MTAQGEATETAATGNRRPPFSLIVAGKIRDLIADRKLEPGDRIPTEAELCTEFGFSRTVVREAIIALRCEGHLVARQGVGVFVTEPKASRFEIDVDAIRTLPRTIMLMELRMALETEAAGLCALRRSQSDAIAIRQHMEMVDALHIEPGQTDVWYDQHFHLAIAEASGNSNIFQLLRMLAPVVMPKIKLGAIVDDAAKDAYVHMIHVEHERIVAAIDAQDAEAARRHMRVHIAAAIARVRRLASALPNFDPRAENELEPEVIRDLVRTAIADRD